MACRLHDAVFLSSRIGNVTDAALLGAHHDIALLAVPLAWTLASAFFACTPGFARLPGSNGLLALLHETSGSRMGAYFGRSPLLPSSHRPPLASLALGKGHVARHHRPIRLSPHGCLVGFGHCFDDSSPPLAHGQGRSHQRCPWLGARGACSAHHGSAILWASSIGHGLFGCNALVPVRTDGLQ